jgi:hypothetical protein
MGVDCLFQKRKGEIMFQQTSKFELNLTGARTPPSDVCSAAIRLRASAIVVDNPVIIPAMLATRMSTRGQWKLIYAVDFPNGREYGFANKILRQNDAGVILGCDGFDILMSARNEVESANEAKSLIEGLKQMNPAFEIRFTIDALSRTADQVKPILKAAKTHPPAMIRLDHHVSLPNLTDEKIDEAIKLVREYTPVPIKFGTSMTQERLAKYAGLCGRFDVDLKTANTIAQQLSAANA